MSNQEEFKNDHLSVQLTREPGSKIKLQIHASPEGVNAAYLKAVKTVNKEVSLPGFRKGKAPDNLVIQNYGKYVDQEWNDLVVKTSFKEAIDLVKVYPFDQDSIKARLNKITRDAGAELTIEFEAAPDVPEINWQELPLNPIPKRAIQPSDIEENLHEIQLHHAEWEEVKDRPVQEGDFVELDIESLDEPGRKLCENTRFDVKEGKMGSWMRTLLLGAKLHDVLEGMSEREPEECTACEHHEEGHVHHHAEFIPTKCRITVKKIETAKLPDLNDELAIKAGVKTVEELRDRVQKTLERHADEEVKENLRKQLENLLIEKYFFEIPASLTKEDKQSRLDLEIGQQKEGDDSLSPEALSQLEAEIERKVEGEYRLFFLIRKFAEENKISVSSEEIMQEFMHQMMLGENGRSYIHSQMDPKEIRHRIYLHLISKKAKDFLIEQVLGSSSASS